MDTSPSTADSTNSGSTGSGSTGSGSSASEVLVTADGPVLTIILNRPLLHNAMTGSMSHQIAAAIDRLDSDASLFVGILTGAGKSFCSGMDLKAFLRGEHPEVPGRGFGGFTSRPPRKPIIAAVEGFALAGGFELVLACDLVVASSTAIFGLPEVKRGLIAGSGGLLRLGNRIPPQIAMEIALTGRNFDAEEASRWGLVNRLTEPGSALKRAYELAAEIARNAPIAIAESKRLLTTSADWPADQRWERQEQALRAVFDSADAAEGARAFAEKRAPRWAGR